MTETSPPCRQFPVDSAAHTHARAAVRLSGGLDPRACLRRIAGAAVCFGLTLSLYAASPGTAHAERYTIPLFALASSSESPKGVLRIVNGEDNAGTVSIWAIDDAGIRSGPATFTLNASEAIEFDASELSADNAAKGLSGGVGRLIGEMRLEIETDLDIVPLAFARSADGVLSAVHDTVDGVTSGEPGTHRYEVPLFYPATEVVQASRLRLINLEDEPASVTIRGRDDFGAEAPDGSVRLIIPAGGARTLTALQLEAGGVGLTGRLGAGTGRWRLTVSSDRPLQAVNVATAGTGWYWNNLSTAPKRSPSWRRHSVPLFATAGTPGASQGVLRVLNGADESGIVEIWAIDDAGARFGPATFMLNAWAAVEFDAAELVSGNPAKDLSGGIGPVTDDVRLEIDTDLEIVPLAFVRAADGALSPMHDTVPLETANLAVGETAGDAIGEAGTYRYKVPTFNPASEAAQVSWLRLVNPDDAAASVTIEGRDDTGATAPGGSVALTLPGGAARTLTALQLEAGGADLTGRLGAGTGRWRLTVSSNRPLQAVNLAAASAGYLYNLSTAAASTSGDDTDDHGNDRAAATEVEAGSDTEGVLYSGDVDYFRIVVDEVGTLEAYTTGGIDTRGWLEDTDGAVLGTDDDGGAGRNFQILEDVSPGTYFIRVMGYSSRVTGDYTLHVRFTESGGGDDADDHGNDRAAATEVEAVSDTEGVLDSGDVDYFRIEVDAAGTLEAYTTGGIDTRGWLEDADGAVLGTDDDGGTGTNFRISEEVSPGTYFIRVMGYSTRVTGDYTLHVRFTESDSGTTPPTDGGQESSYGPGDAITELPTGTWTPDTVSAGARVTSSVDGVRIEFDEGAYIEVGGFRYTCQSAEGCVIVNGAVESGTVVRSPASEVTPDTQPSFPSGSGPGELTSTVGEAIDSLTLPEASGGDAPLTYLLTPSVPGLAFDAATRRLSGTTTASGNYAMTYAVSDADGDTDTLNFTIAVAEAVPDTVAESFDLRSGELGHDPIGIAHADDRFYILDAYDRNVYVYSASGQRDAAAEFVLDEDSHIPSTIVHTGGRFYVVDTYANSVNVYTVSGERDAAADFALDSDNDAPVGIAYADGRFHVIDGYDEKVYAYSVSGQRDAAADFPLDADNDAPADIAYAAGRFHVIDGYDEKAYAYSVSGQRDATADFALGSGNVSPAGVVYADSRFHVVDSNSGVYAYGSDGQRDAAADFALHVSRPYGVTYANGRFYYLAGDSVRAYGADGQRDAAADFALAADNDAPTAIVYANGRFHVYDWHDIKMYAYGANGQHDAAADFNVADFLDLDSYPFPRYDLVYANGRFFFLGVQHLIAYRADGRRDAASDVELDVLEDDKINPQGFAYANGRFYILHNDIDGVRIYAFQPDGQRDTAADIEVAADHDPRTAGALLTYANGRLYQINSAEPSAPAVSYTLPAESPTGSATDTENTGSGSQPDFAAGGGLDNPVHGLTRTLSYAVGAPIAPLTLPTASGGNGPLTYSVAPEVPGLTFNPVTLRLAGTPSMAGEFSVAYAVTDADGDSDTLNYAIAVEESNAAVADAFELVHVRGRSYGDYNDKLVIAYANGRLYVVDDFDDKVYAYSVSGERDPGGDFYLDPNNQSPCCITYAEGRFYVVGAYLVAGRVAGYKVYAYGADGRRDAAADFELHEENHRPWGIAYANGRFHVFDNAGGSEQHRVFAYRADGQFDAIGDIPPLTDRSFFNIQRPYGSFRTAYANGRFHASTGGSGGAVYAYSLATGEYDPAGDFRGYGSWLAYANGRFYSYHETENKVFVSPRTGPLFGPQVRRSPVGQIGTDRVFTYSVGKAIQPVTLPAARHNDGTLAYSLTPAVPGLSFDPETRQLTGTPSAANNYTMTYTVTNAQGYTDTLEYIIAVHNRLQSGDNNDSPRGIAYAKGRFYVLDDSDEMVYAYSTSGARDAAADIDPRLVKNYDLDLKKYTAPLHRGIYYVDGNLNFVRTHEATYLYSYPVAGQPPYPERSGRYLYVRGGGSEGWRIVTYGDGAYSFFFTIHPNSSSGESLDGNDFLVRRIGADGLLLDDRIFESDVDIGRMAGSVHVGDRVYVVDAGVFGAGKVYAFSASGERDATADFELDPDNRGAVAIAYANGRFYIADEFELKVFAYTVSGQRDAAADFDLSTHEDMDMRNERSDDVVVVQDRVYVLDRDVGRVFAYLPTGERDASRDFGLDEGNAQPVQIAYAEGRIYVVNNVFSVDLVDKVYAYTLDGRRDAGADFDLDERNHRPVGLTYAEGRFYVVDVGQKVYAYTLDGSRAAAADFDLHFHNRDPAGIVYADGLFYVIDRSYLQRGHYFTQMFAYRADGRLEPFLTRPQSWWWELLLGEWVGSSGQQPDGRQWESFGGLAYSDGQFHIVSVRERTLNLRSFNPIPFPLDFAYPTYPGDLETVDGPVFFTVGAAIDPFTLPTAVGGVAGTETYSLSPDVPGLSFDPETRQITGTLSAADSWDMTYTVTDANGDADTLNFTISAKLDLTLGGGYNNSPVDVAYANGRFYVLDDSGGEKVYAYSTSGERDAAADFNLDADNDRPGGITWADGRFYVTDAADDKVYAYEADGQRDAAADFGLDADNDRPVGITWADGRFYVTDAADDKVYAHEADGQTRCGGGFRLGRRQ